MTRPDDESIGGSATADPVHGASAPSECSAAPAGGAEGKSLVVEPEVRSALPTGKLLRMIFVGWYSLLGYGVIRNWGLDVGELGASVASAPTFSWWV